MIGPPLSPAKVTHAGRRLLKPIPPEHGRQCPHAEALGNRSRTGPGPVESPPMSHIQFAQRRSRRTCLKSVLTSRQPGAGKNTQVANHGAAMMLLDLREPINALSHGAGMMPALPLTWVFRQRCVEQVSTAASRDGRDGGRVTRSDKRQNSRVTAACQLCHLPSFIDRANSRSDIPTRP